MQLQRMYGHVYATANFSAINDLVQEQKQQL